MIKNKNLRVYEALAHEVAMDAAARRELTPEQREESRRLLEYAHTRLAEIELADKEAVAAKPSGKVRRYVAMKRDAMVKRLGEIFATQPSAVFAHRDLASMSDDDLRTALEDAESMLERVH